MMRLSPESSQALVGLLREVAGVGEERKLWAMTLDALASRFGADSGAILLYRRSSDDLYKVRSLMEGATWDRERTLEFFHNRKPELAETTIMAPVRAGRRVVGVLALGRERAFDKGAGKEVTEMLKAVGRWVGLRRELAIQGAECATARDVLEGVAPKDLVYRILHQLRRFIGYNHGATVIIFADERTGRVLARQVAWNKGRSDLVGRTLPVMWKEVMFDGRPVIMKEKRAPLRDSLKDLRERGAPGKESIMIGPLALGDTGLGMVEVSSSAPDFFIEDDVRTLARFLPYLAWCVEAFSRSTGGYHG